MAGTNQYKYEAVDIVQNSELLLPLICLGKDYKVIFQLILFNVECQKLPKLAEPQKLSLFWAQARICAEKYFPSIRNN